MAISMIICSFGVVLLWMLSLVFRADRKSSNEIWRIRSLAKDFGVQVLDNWRKDLNKLAKRAEDRFLGQLQGITVKTSIAEKTADRAFNLANSATLGVVALQKALATPRIINREQSKLNQLAKNSVDELFTTQGEYDWLKPLLSDADLELVEEIERKKLKEQLNSKSQ